MAAEPRPERSESRDDVQRTLDRIDRGAVRPTTYRESYRTFERGGATARDTARDTARHARRDTRR